MNLWVLFIGDIVMLIVFALLGQSSHKIAVTAAGTLETAAPFIIGWVIVSLVEGLYKVKHYRTLPTVYKRTVLAWVLAIPLGLGLRALYLQKGIPLSFFIVAMTSNFILLFLWRTVFFWFSNRRNVS